MRVLELGLTRYGPFTDTVLDFRASPNALHIIYGPNEAGKSTALRALTALLYGIETRTSDAHLHSYSKLLLSACVETDFGVLELQRRKGSKNTLSLAGGEVFPEARMLAVLGGVSQASFESAFALDGPRLRQGGRSLVEGSGEVGQVLFDASSGGPSVERALAKLRAEADELFKPGRAKNPALNAALAKHGEVKKALKLRVTDPATYAKQEQQLVAKKQEKRLQDDRLRELRGQRMRLNRALAVLPDLRRRAQCLQRLDVLRSYESVAPDLRARREQLEGELRDAESEVRTRSQAIERLEKRLEELGPAEVVLGVAPTELASLEQLVGRERKALLDLPKRREALAGKSREVQAALSRLGLGSVTEAERLSLSPQQSQLVNKLATARPPSAEEIQLDFEEATERTAQAQEALSALGNPPDCSNVERRLDRTRRRGDLDERVVGVEAEIRTKEGRLGRLLRELAPWQGSADELQALTLPKSARLEELSESEAKLAEARARLTDKERDQREGRDEAEAGLQALVQGQGVPSEAELAENRKRRDEAFESLRPALLGSEARSADDIEAYEVCVTAADAVSDRLRREAERVQRCAQHEAQIRKHERHLGRLATEAGELQEARRALGQRLADCFASVGFVPDSIKLAGDWLARAQAARDDAAELHAMRADRDSLQEARVSELAALSECLGEDLTGMELAQGIDRALERVAAAREHQSALADAVAKRDAARAQKVAAERRLARARKKERSWSEEWKQATADLGLGDAPAPELVISVLRDAQELGALERERENLERRIGGIQRDSEELRGTVTRLASVVGQDAQSLHPVELAELIIASAREARSRDEQRQAFHRDLEESRAALHAAVVRQGDSQGQLESLMQQVGASTREELIEAEERVLERAAAVAELQRLESALSQSGEGVALDRLESETAGLDLASVRHQLSEIDDELEPLDEQRQNLAVDISALTKGLEDLATDAGVLAADSACAVASEIRELAERWVRLKLAIVVLSREIERYREANQGTLLTRAAELFSELTEGRYAGVRSELGEDDRFALRAVREDQTTLAVGELSEGTADQLYLALRLSSYERHLNEGACLPLVLDDVLASFDDDRGRAALRALVQVAARGQVFLFTHHEHVVRAASEAFGAAQLGVHRLQKPAVSAERPSPSPTSARSAN